MVFIQQTSFKFGNCKKGIVDRKQMIGCKNGQLYTNKSSRLEKKTELLLNCQDAFDHQTKAANCLGVKVCNNLNHHKKAHFQLFVMKICTKAWTEQTTRVSLCLTLAEVLDEVIDLCIAALSQRGSKDNAFICRELIIQSKFSF